MYDIQSSVFKQIDDPWLALLILGIFMFLSSITAIIVLCLVWRRHRMHTQMKNENYILNNQQIDPRQLQSYETQKMEVYVPQSEGDTIRPNFGEFHTHFTPQDGIQDMHQFYQRTNKAYF